MLKRTIPPLLLYLFISGFVATWWFWAFKETNHSTLPFNEIHTSVPTFSLLNELSRLDRNPLHNALAGDFQLMMEFISNWDVDAQILQEYGIERIERLPRETYLKAHLLAQLIANSTEDELKMTNRRLAASSLKDSNGKTIKILDTFCRFLPQTYVSASFLLAFAKPQEIVALPKGMRALSQLYSPDQLNLIPLNSDRCNSEKLFLADPHVAFVAPYSHPATLEALRQQKISLYTPHTIDTVEDIQKALLEIGHASNHPIEAHLLSIFIEAGLISIDNRLKALSVSSKPKNLLYLCYFQQYRVPTTKSLTGQLLARALQNHAGLNCPVYTSPDEWLIPFDREKIFNANPDYLIVSIPSANEQKARHKHQHHLQNSNASKKNQIAYVDEAIQDSPTQYIVLAYFDLFHALAGIQAP